MSVIMEFVVIVIYVIAGLVVPLNDDYYAGQTVLPEAGTSIPLYTNYVYPPGPSQPGLTSSVSVAQKPANIVYPTQ